MPKYFLHPFANNGDRVAVPDESVTDEVSYEKGYTPAYELPKTNPDRRNIDRQPFNGALFAVTENLKFWQENGAPEIVADSGSGSPLSYSKGFVGSLGGVTYAALVDGTTTVPPSAEWEVVDFSTLNQRTIYVGSVAEIKSLAPVADQQVRLDLSGKLFNYVFVDTDLSSQIAPFLAATPSYTQGVYIAPDSDTSGASGAWVLLIENNEVDIAVFGIVGGDGIQYELAPIVDWAESNDVNLTGAADGANPVEFTDTFNVKHIRLGGKDPLHMRYVGPLDIEEAPIIVLGEPDFATYGPARFASNKQYRVGEVLQFSGGTWGDVLFTMGGHVYFHAVLDGGVFPSNGETVSGLSSGRTDTVAGIRAQAFTPTNYSGRLENIFLTTTLDLDGNGRPLSHTQATGIVANGVRGARWFGGVKNVVTQGFYNGFIAVHSYFMNFDGFLTTNRCAYGTLIAEECNQINLNNIVNSISGTPYDGVARRSFRLSYSYGVKLFIDSETQTDTSFQQITSCQGININGGDVEFYENGQAWKYGGSPALEFVGDPASEENKKYWNRAISFRNLRAFQCLLFLTESYNDGVNIEDIACDYNVGDPLAVVSNVISFSGATNCKNIRLRNVVSRNFDFKAAFESAHVLSDNVEFSDDCYEVIELSGSFYIPAAKTSINLSRKVSAANTRFELLDVSFGNEFGESVAMDAALFDFDSGVNSWNFTLGVADTGPEYGTFRSSSFAGSGRYTNTDGFRVRLTNLRNDTDNWYNYAIRMRRLAI